MAGSGHLGLETAVKKMLQPFRRDTAAGIRHAEQQLLSPLFQLYGDGAAGSSEFQRVGQQMIEQLFHGGGTDGADRRSMAQTNFR